MNKSSTTVPDPSHERRPIAYACSRLNKSTHLVVHKDTYEEFPFIYVKTYPKLRAVVIIDTGCGAHNTTDADAPLAELKSFIDSSILADDASGSHSYEYIVVCTHCHFDHIGGIQSFADAGATIIASARDPSFVSRANLPANSLCPAFGTRTPQYDVTQFANDKERLAHRDADLGLRVLHTPGHTPDSLALYDEGERWLFIGDTCYRRTVDLPWGERQEVPIVFPQQGDWRDFAETLKRLKKFVEAEEGAAAADAGAGERGRIRIACGHTTSDAFAGKLVEDAWSFFCAVVSGKVAVMARMRGDEVAPGGTLGDEMFVLWQDDGDPEFSMVAPERWEDEFRSSMQANSPIWT